VSREEEKDEDGKSEGRALKILRNWLTATLTFVTATLTVVFLLVPEWRPLSRDKIESSLEVPTVDSGVTVLDWARRQYPRHPMRELHKLIGAKDFNETVKTPGTVVYVLLHADGFKHRSIKLRARVYETETRVSPPPEADIGQVYPSAGRLEIDAPSRASVQLILLDDLTDTPKPVFVRVEAYDDEGILAYADSPTITDGIAASPAGNR
jgi:hypothetical protein